MKYVENTGRKTTTVDKEHSPIRKRYERVFNQPTMSDSDAPSEDLSSDEEDMNEPISLPAPSNFSPSSSTNTNNNTIINKAKSTPLEIPDYPHRCCCLLHKWNKYEPTVFCINKNGIALYDWSQTIPTLTEEWSYESIVSVTPSTNDQTTFSVEIQRSGFSLRNSVWTFSSTRRPYIVEQIYTFRELDGAPKSVHFEGHLIDTARSRHSVTVYVKLGSIRVVQQTSIGSQQELQVPTIDMVRVVKLNDIENGVVLVCRSHGSLCMYVLEFPPNRRDVFVQMICINYSKIMGSNDSRTETGYNGSTDGSGSKSNNITNAAVPVVSGSLLDVVPTATLNARCDWDWSRSSPNAPSSLPQQSTYDAEYTNMRRRCKLVWTNSFLLDVDIESHQVLKFWHSSRIRALWCSERHPTRISVVIGLDENGIVGECKVETYDVMRRDALFLTIVGSSSGSHVATMVSPGVDPSFEANFYERSRLLQPSFIVQTKQLLTDNGGSNDGGRNDVMVQERHGAIYLLLRQLASTAADNVRPDMSDDRIWTTARTLCSSVPIDNGCRSTIKNADDDIVARSSLASIAQQIISARIDVEPAKVHMLLTAATRMLQSLSVFSVFMELQSCVIMINRLFQELALYISTNKPNSPSRSGSRNESRGSKGNETKYTSGFKSRPPCHSLIIRQILCLLSALVKYDGAKSNVASSTSHESTNTTTTSTATNINLSMTEADLALIFKIEKLNRSELFGSKRGDILANVLRHSISSSSKGPSSSSSVSELVAHECLRLFAHVVCGESALSTSPEHLQYIMPMLTDHTLFLSLFALNNDPVATLSANLLREIITKAPLNFVQQMRRQVLSDGTALVHFRSSLFSTEVDVRAQSRFMLSLWMDSHPLAMSLLRRTLPQALVDLVDVKTPIGEAKSQRSTTARWDSLFLALSNNHETPTLVWDDDCRSTLKIALDNEIEELDRQRQVMRQHARGIGGGSGSGSRVGSSRNSTLVLGSLRRKGTTVSMKENGVEEQKEASSLSSPNNSNDDNTISSVGIAWNFRDFSVIYTSSSRASSVVVKGIYLVPLVRKKNGWNSHDFPIHPNFRRHFFEQVYRRSVAERRNGERFSADSDWSANVHRTCLRAMAVSWPFVSVDSTDNIGSMVAKEMSDVLTSTPFMETRSVALELMTVLLSSTSVGRNAVEDVRSHDGSRSNNIEEPSNSFKKSSDVLASISLSFAQGGGIDACAQMLSVSSIKKTDYTDIASKESIINSGGNGGSVDGKTSTGISSNSSINNRDVKKRWMYRHAPGCNPVGPVSITRLKHLLSTREITYRTEVRCQSSAVNRNIKNDSNNDGNNNNNVHSWSELRYCTPLLSVLTYAPSQRYCENLVDQCLSVLVLCCTACPSREKKTGAIVWPMPLPHRRLLFGESCLKRVVQILMTTDAKNNGWKTINKAAQLLCIALEDDHLEIMPKLYLSGLFYFVMLSCSKETILPLCHLLSLTHLRQRFPLWQPLPTGTTTNVNTIGNHKNNNKSNKSNTCSKRASGRLLARASVLGTILPESMLFVLEYGHQQSQLSVSSSIDSFSKIFLGDANTPAVIWTKEMRKHMYGELKEHLSRFRLLLDDDPTMLYEFEPIPPIEYDELKSEVYCHSYFLNNLCDYETFPNWIVQDPVALLRDVLDTWRNEIKTASQIENNETMSYQRASEIMEFKQNPDTGVVTINSKILRKKYLKLALRMHPDRNGGEGKEEFAQLHLAYKRLSLIVSGRVNPTVGSDSNRRNFNGQHVPVSDHVTMHLLLKVQTLLYKRYPNILSAVKYPMYDQLVQLCASGRVTDIVPRLSMQTLSHVSVAANGNAEELLNNRGFELVVSALRASSGAIDDNAVSIRVSCLLATSAILSVPKGREKLANCASMKATLYDVLNEAKRSKEKRDVVERNLQHQQQEDSVLDSALASLYHIAISNDMKARSSMVERGCFYPLLRLALLGDEDEKNNSTSSTSASASPFPITAGRPWSGHPLRRCDVSMRILLLFAGFRHAGNAIENDDEHDYVRNGLQRVLSEPMVRLLARSFSNLSSTTTTTTNDLWCQILLQETVSPLLIWDENMRNSVVRFVDAQTFDVVDEDATFVDNNTLTTSSFSSSSSSMFSKALGPIHGFNHDRLSKEPLVGGIYLKPFVYRKHHPLTRDMDDLYILEDLGVSTYQLSTDLVRYIERATTASAIVSGELHSSAKMAAEAAVHDHTLGVLYSLKALSTILSFGRVGVVDGCNEEDGAECAGQVVSLLMHHTTPIFACASGHMTGTPYVTASGQALELSIAAFHLLQSACEAKKVHNQRRLNQTNSTNSDINNNINGKKGSNGDSNNPMSLKVPSTATGEMFAKSAVEAGVLWMLLDSLRQKQPCPQDRLQHVLNTLHSFVRCSPVSSAHLSGLGVAVDLLWLVADTDEMHSHRLTSCKIISELVAQPSCGSQVRSSLLRMIPIRLLQLILFASTEDPTKSLRTDNNGGMNNNFSGGGCGGGGGIKGKNGGSGNNTSNSDHNDPVDIFDSNHDNAELIWNEQCRQELRSSLTSLRAEILQRMTINGSPYPTEAWSLPSTYILKYTLYESTFVVANVFVKKYLQDTSVVLSDPQSFAIELMRVLTTAPMSNEKHQQLVTPPPTVTTAHLSLLIRAFVSLVMQNPQLASRVVMSGIPHQLLHRMLDAAGEHDTQLACLSAMTQLVLHSEAAVQQV
jgi:hypothetical protein